MARRGQVGRSSGTARHGWAGFGEARSGEDWERRGQEWPGWVWSGLAGPGSAWCGNSAANEQERIGMATVTKNGKNRVANIGGDTPTNGGEAVIVQGMPYTVDVSIYGSADLLMHRWNCEAVEEKSKAAKGSKAKKTDDIESYVYRTEDGELAIPGEYLRQAIIHAAKYRQDPRSPRKSAMDLFKAALVVDPLVASLGTKEWDYIDTRRVVVQRSGINRSRPALRAGWMAEFSITVLLPEYVSAEILLEVLNTAGRLIGVGDFRPTYGRFQVCEFTIRQAD